MSIASLLSLVEAVEADADAYRRNPLAYFEPTPPQAEWLADGCPVKLFRAANQLGKTWGQAVELIHRMRGTHPYLRTHEPPIQAWVICHSWEQSVDVQTKVWELLPKEELAPGTDFVEGRGFRGKTPMFALANGSICRFKTTNQGSLGVASATLHYVGIDEPPPPEIWGELNARVLRHGGVIGMTLTPIGRPVGWLRDLVEDGVVSDHRFSLTVENCTPRGGIPFVTKHGISHLEKIYLPMEARQRLHGEWEGAVQGRVFQAFDEDMVCEVSPTGKLRIGIGIDHGTDAGSQVAILVAIDLSGEHPKLWVLDEYVSSGTTTPEQDAEGIMRMLRRNSMRPENVDRWCGDRRHGGKRWGGAKSNRMLEDAFGRLMRLPVGRLPFRIRTIKKSPGYVWVDARVLHGAMLRGHFFIRPRCETLVESLRYWQGLDDENKHAIDALRYGAVPLMTTRPYLRGRVGLY